MRPFFSKQQGFTLLEVLVALVIVGTALGASVRALGSVTRNSGDLRETMLAGWSAENRLVHMRVGREWPALGKTSYDCSQDSMHLVCQEEVLETPNANFRRVEITVFDSSLTGRRVLKLAQVIANEF
jgi:general secretion pathway protein I